MHEIEPTPRSITWYRTPLDSKVFKSLHEKSDLLGWLQTLMHAWFDFPLQCPAILLTWCALLTAAGRWVEISKS